ncbi:DMT family transporter [Pseudonocardia sp. RS010]|uniref:DMT family transporter n=1 Tax=Pseudonocardia sp. RS010 TaxID=3385979 RepID=UPI0039A328FE
MPAAPGSTSPAGPVRAARARPGRMLVIVLAWASCFVLVMWGMRDAPVLWFAALRALVAGVALLAATVVAGRGGGLFPRSLAAWALIGVLAATNVTVAFAAMFGSVTGVTTGVAAVLSNSTPLLLVLPAWWLFGERPRFAEIAGVALGFGGLLLVAAPSGGGRGAGLALAAAVGIGAGALLARRSSGVNLLALGAGQFLLGGAALAGAAALVEGPPTITWSARFVTALAVLALAATVLPYLLWFGELRRAPITSVTVWTLLVPVVGVILGVVVLGERVTLTEGIGDAIVVAALALVTYANRASRRVKGGEPNLDQIRRYESCLGTRRPARAAAGNTPPPCSR